jgi:hypothetical protein
MLIVWSLLLIALSGVLIVVWGLIELRLNFNHTPHSTVIFFFLALSPFLLPLLALLALYILWTEKKGTRTMETKTLRRTKPPKNSPYNLQNRLVSIPSPKIEVLEPEPIDSPAAKSSISVSANTGQYGKVRAVVLPEPAFATAELPQLTETKPGRKQRD